MHETPLGVKNEEKKKVKRIQLITFILIMHQAEKM